MLDDQNDYIDEEEIQVLLQRFREMIAQKCGYLDTYEYEIIIDYFIDHSDFVSAIMAAELAIKQHQASLSLKLKYIQLLIDTGKPGRALCEIKKIDEAGAFNQELCLVKGFALNLTGKSDEAKIEFEKVLKLCTEDKDDVAYQIASSYMQIDFIAQAIKYLLKALMYNDKNILVLQDLALNYEKVDRPDKSIYYYHKYLELDTFSEPAWNNLGLLYADIGNDEEAYDAFDMAIAVNPHFFSAYFNKADLLLKNTEYQRAIKIYHDLLSIDKANTRALSSLGNCFQEAGDFQQAVQSYNAAIKIADDYSLAWYGKGLALFRQKKYKLSYESFRKAITLEPDNYDFRIMFAETCIILGNFDKAIAAYSKAAELNPLDYEVRIACAHALFKKGKIEEAIQMLNKFYENHSNDSTLNYRLAAYYVYLNDRPNALYFFEKALTLNYQEHNDILVLYPKTAGYPGFQILIDRHFKPAKSYKSIK
jgi:tetratricopeptide (TPR) repeat protein